MNAFIRKLRHSATLTAADEGVLAKFAEPVRRVGRGDIMPEGMEPRHIILVLEGWVCRYKQLEDGKRQITSIFLPGDLCEPFGALPRSMDHSLGALTPVGIALVDPQALRGAARTNPRVEDALWWDLLLSDSFNREHMVSLGRRSATERLGHLFCAVQFRLGLVGLADPSSCEIPLTQADLADLLGLSAVHVNRSLQELRRTGLIALRGRRLTVFDVPGLRELSMFTPPSFQTPSASPLEHP